MHPSIARFVALSPLFFVTAPALAGVAVDGQQAELGYETIVGYADDISRADDELIDDERLADFDDELSVSNFNDGEYLEVGFAGQADARTSIARTLSLDGPADDADGLWWRAEGYSYGRIQNHYGPTSLFSVTDNRVALQFTIDEPTDYRIVVSHTFVDVTVPLGSVRLRNIDDSSVPWQSQAGEDVVDQLGEGTLPPGSYDLATVLLNAGAGNDWSEIRYNIDFRLGSLVDPPDPEFEDPDEPDTEDTGTPDDDVPGDGEPDDDCDCDDAPGGCSHLAARGGLGLGLVGLLGLVARRRR